MKMNDIEYNFKFIKTKKFIWFSKLPTERQVRQHGNSTRGMLGKEKNRGKEALLWPKYQTHLLLI